MLSPAGPDSLSPHTSFGNTQGPSRTSALLAPTMLLTGHADQVFTLKFNPDGDVLATGSYDKTILLYRTYGECENFLQIKGGVPSCSWERRWGRGKGSGRWWERLIGAAAPSPTAHAPSRTTHIE